MESPSTLSRELPIRTKEQVDSPQQPDPTPKGEGRDKEPAPSDSHLEARTDEAGGLETTTVDWVEPESKPKKKKKRNNRPKSKRGKNKPTGFEEFYVDAPITPEQHKEERSIYDVSRPIIHRMEDAILRFQKNRRIEAERREIFLKYLSYGGVDVGPKMFGGVDDRDLQEMDSEQILMARGQTSIRADRSDLDVDFNAVVKGYLTSFFPCYFNPETEDMVKLATVTIRNFLSYILYHDVCPEYKDNIDEARTSCDIASKELWNNQQMTAQGPGGFNTAASTLFGGFFFEMYVEDNKWENTKDESSLRMTNEVARKVVKFALAGAGSDKQAIRFQELANTNALRAMRVEDIDGFEVAAVILPDEETHEFYQTHASDLHPVGRLLAKAYRDPGKPGFDLSPEESSEWENGGAPMPEFEFFLEENLLKFCYVGMKVITSVWELNCGLHFFDEVFTAYSSIYTVLANDLMLGWKKPKDLRDSETDGEDEEVGEQGKGDALGETDKEIEETL